MRIEEDFKELLKLFNKHDVKYGDIRMPLLKTALLLKEWISKKFGNIERRENTEIKMPFL